MMAAALLFQATAAAPPAMRITPSSRTAPIVDAACKITDPEGRQFDLIIHQSGGRGYQVTRNGQTSFPRTRVKQDIVRDTGSIFEGFDFQLDPGQTWPGRVKALKRPGHQIEIETFETGSQGKFAILLRRQWPMNDVHLMGYCDVKKTSQAPLTAAETEEAIKQ